MYHLIKARVQKKMGHPEESVNTMQAAMNLPGVKKAGNIAVLMSSLIPCMSQVCRMDSLKSARFCRNDRILRYLQVFTAFKKLSLINKIAKM